MPTINPTTTLQHVAPSFNLFPFREMLGRFIEEALRETGHSTCRAGTILIPRFVVWFVLAMVIRRDLNLLAVVDWMLSGLQWMELNLSGKLLSEGALSHARVRLGSQVFALLFEKFTASLDDLEPDFKGFISVAFDGTSLTMPDTPSNVAKYGKPATGRSAAAFPQLRGLGLLAPAGRVILDFAFGPCRGKGTGERQLMMTILKRTLRDGLLFLLDAGFYSFAVIRSLGQGGRHFIIKAPKSVKYTRLPGKDYGDGSYLAETTGRVNGKKERLTVRVIEFQLRGFRPSRLVTNLLDPRITALEIARHYHKRWDIEIAWDEIKTHQAATMRGQSPTVLRSKRADLVEQEVYALLIVYNAVRQLMREAAAAAGKKAEELSFLDTLQVLIDAIPITSRRRYRDKGKAREYLLYRIAIREIDRPRRGRLNPRVVKVKMSNFKRKTDADKGEIIDFEKRLSIISQVSQSTPPNDCHSNKLPMA